MLVGMQFVAGLHLVSGSGQCPDFSSIAVETFDVDLQQWVKHGAPEQ